MSKSLNNEVARSLSDKLIRSDSIQFQKSRLESRTGDEQETIMTSFPTRLCLLAKSHISSSLHFCPGARSHQSSGWTVFSEDLLDTMLKHQALLTPYTYILVHTCMGWQVLRMPRIGITLCSALFHLPQPLPCEVSDLNARTWLSASASIARPLQIK